MTQTNKKPPTKTNAQLSKLEQKRLNALSKELKKASRVVGSIIHNSSQTLTTHQAFNKKALEETLGNILCSMIILCDERYLSESNVHQSAELKMKNEHPSLSNTKSNQS